MVTTRKTGPAQMLFGKARLAVLSALFADPTRSLHLREISRIGSIAPTALSRELNAMLSTGIITEERSGNQRRFQANPQNPMFEPLRLIALTVATELPTELPTKHPTTPASAATSRKSARIGLSIPHDWSNSALDDDVLIAKTLASQRFDDVVRVCRAYGSTRVRAVMEDQILDALARAILQRQLDNIESVMRE